MTKVRTRQDQHGTAVEIVVAFGAARFSAIMQRLTQVARALEIRILEEGQPPTDDCRRFVTKVETDLAGGAILVRALVPESKTVEEMQAELLALVPLA